MLVGGSSQEVINKSTSHEEIAYKMIIANVFAELRKDLSLDSNETVEESQNVEGAHVEV